MMSGRYCRPTGMTVHPAAGIAFGVGTSVGFRMLIAWLSASSLSSATFVVRGLSSATCRMW
jgi:hypothetical protein